MDSKLAKGQVKLDFLHAFGSLSSAGIRDSVCFGDDESSIVLFPVGRHIAVRSLDTNEVTFISEPSSVSAITAMTISKERSRRFLAVGEYLEKEKISQVTIIDIKNQGGYKRLRELRIPDQNAKFSTLAFSYDSKLIACVSGGMGIVWDWYKEKIIGKEAIGAEITRISVNPKDSHLVSTSGPNHWKTWRVEEKIFKEQPMFSKLAQTQNFTDHDWLDDDTVIAVTDMAEAFISRGNQIVQYIEFGLGKISDTMTTASVTCMLGFSRGFIMASDEGFLSLWERAETNELEDQTQELFSFIKSWNCGKKQAIVSLALSNSEETLTIALKSNDIGTCSLSQVIMYDSVKFNIFCGGFHSGKINEMDVAIQRPLLVTCSESDATLRIWNYHSMNCELAKKLYVVERDSMDPAGEAVSRPLLSVAFHPSGYYIAVSFVDRVRLFHLLYDELRFFREINAPRSNVLKFSNGGHMLAAASGQTILIYESYTLECLQIMNAHSSLVQEMSWSYLDKKLFTVGADGAMFEFATNTWTKEKEHINTNIEYCSLTITDEDTVIASGWEGQQAMLLEKADYEWKLQKIDKSLTQVCFFQSSHRNPVLLGSTNEGTILNFGSGKEKVWLEEIDVHQGAITKLRASPDGRFVFSAGEDGAIFVFKVDESLDYSHLEHITVEGKEKELSARVVDDTLAEIVLIERGQLDKFKDALDQERQELEKMNHTITSSSKLRESQYQGKLQEIRDSIMENIRAQQVRIEELSAQKTRQERDYEKKLSQLEADHNKEVDSLETMYERKLGIEDERFRQLEHDKVEMKQHYEDQIKNIKVHNEQAVESLEKAFRDALCKATEEYESTKRTAEELKEIYEKRLSQQEDEHEIEVLDLKDKFETQLKELKKQYEELVKIKKEYKQAQSVANQDKQEGIQKIERKRGKIEKKREEIMNLRQQIKNLEQAIKEKEETLMKKDNQIYEYKRQIKDLEETKKLLHSRKLEILDEMQPKEEEIEMLGTRIKNVRTDLQKERKDNEELERSLNKLEDLLRRLKIDNKAQQAATQEVETVIRSIINDIHHAVSTLDIVDWPDELKKLYQNYVREDGSKIRKDADSIEELEHQLRYMEKSITGIRENSKKSMKRFKVDMRKRTQENSTLIQELNKLRFENKRDEFRIKQLEQMIEKAQESAKARDISPKQQGKPIHMNKEQAATPYLGYVNKPSPMEHKFASLQDRQRIIDLQNELEEKKEQNFYLRMEINQLREMLGKTPQ